MYYLALGAGVSIDAMQAVYDKFPIAVAVTLVCVCVQHKYHVSVESLYYLVEIHNIVHSHNMDHHRKHSSEKVTPANHLTDPH